MTPWMKFSLTLAAIAAFAAASWHLAPTLEGAPGDAYFVRNTKVGVVNIEAVTNDYLRHTGSIETSKNKFLTEQRALDVLRETIQSMDQESEVFPKDSPRYLELRTQIAIKSEEYKVRSQSVKLSQDREQATLMREAYEKALEVIERFAKDRGLDLVLLKQDGKLKGMDLAEVGSNILVRTVVYHDESMDITEDIKELMKK